MEKHPQADSSQKSPVSKVLPPVPPEDVSKAKSNAIANGSSLDKKLESSPTLTSKTYQENKSEPSAEIKPLESAAVANKNGQISESTAEADKSSPHPIISVDIQKSMPYENKQVVPQDSAKPEVDVKPEVVASVVTTAVVKEATLTVSDTENNVLNGSKITSDSSKVDAVVEKELAKISDSSSEKTELKTTILSDTNSKCLLNGDIDHSPINETITSGSSKNEKCPKNEGAESIVTQEIGKDTETANSDVSSCNGVPGIITVETITKKDISSTPEKNLQTEFAKSDEKEKSENVSQGIAESEDVPKSGDLKEQQKSTKPEKDIDDSKTAHDGAPQVSTMLECDKNLTDSAKLLKESPEIGKKVEQDTSLKPSLTATNNLIQADTKVESSKFEEKFSETTKLSEPSKEDSTKDETVTSEESTRISGKQEHLEEKISESEPTKTSESEEVPSKSDKPSETEKKDSKTSEIMPSESKKDTLETTDKGIICASEAKSGPKSVNDDNGDAKKSEMSSFAEKSSVSQTPNSDQEKTTVDKSDEFSKADDSHAVVYDMTAMMTSQILTPEMLNATEETEQLKDSSTDDSKDEKDSGEKDAKDLTKSEDGSRISASRKSPETCDVGVGLDEKKMARVAAGDGGEEEVDGQQATTEVEVTEESLASHADEADNENLVPSGAHSPTSASPTSDRSQSSAKLSPTPPSKPSSAISQKEDVKNEDAKPASAVSRSSIPEPIVYEPPERRKSATSTSSDEKKDSELNKSQKDEKESEKSSEAPEVGSNKEQIIEESSEATAEKEESKEDSKTDDVEIGPEKEPTAEEKSNVSEEATKEEEKLMEKEKGEEDAKEKEDVTSKKQDSIETEENAEVKSEDTVKPNAAEDEKEPVTDERTEPADTNAQDEDTEEKEVKEEAESKQEADSDTKQESEINTSEDAGAEETANTSEENEGQSTDNITTEDVGSDDKTDEVKEEKGEDVKDEEDEKSKLDSEVEKLTDEPTTLVEEHSKAESSEKEATGPEEKEEDEAEAKEEDKGGAEEGEIVREDETQKEAENEAIEETETVKIEEQEEQKESEETEEKTSQEQEATEEEPKDEEKEEDKDAEKEVKEETEEGNEPEPTDEPEKQDVEKEEPEEKPESPPKSPTKRMRSPDKSGRRGVSPISSPPKPLKTPPSPQKPQKSTSPKKKNGMLSPIKTPKTPGSDGRKLPPIKAPVGLAPNPNLKNIRSKIGSFDNIRYKPGGGDKKVISKKLEWKAAPKIGSLDHSFKGEKKHGKSFSKGESKEGKLVDGQSPLPSGDEGEQDGAAAATESVIKPESGPSTEMPAAIAAES